MSPETLTKEDQIQSQSVPTSAAADDEVRERSRTQVKRVRRLKIHVTAWALGTILLTALWVLNEWQGNGAFERFGHDGDPGDWNPTLWALGVGIWGLVVGIMALRVFFRRPATDAEIDRRLERLKPQITAERIPTDSELRRFTRARSDRVGRLKFHVAAWVLGMIVLTPLWALIEWQDNGGFERWSNNSQPGNWEPWILYVGGIWALVIALFALTARFGWPTTRAEFGRDLRRLRRESSDRAR